MPTLQLRSSIYHGLLLMIELRTFDGSLDDRISIGGLENFTVPNVGEVDEDDTEDVEPGNEIELDGSVAVEDDVVEDLSM